MFITADDPTYKKNIPQLEGKQRGKEKNDRRGMITTCKHCDSGGQANERARTGIESERARAVFQNIHSHIGQWTFGYILSGVGEGGSVLNAWDPRKRIHQGMGMAVSQQSPENALKAPPPQTGLLKNTLACAQAPISLVL